MFNFSLLPITKSTSSKFEYFSGSICAAHPVTIIFFSGNLFLDLRISYFTFFSASAVTAQELIRHQLRVVIYVNEINEQMYVAGSRYIQHPNYPSNNIIAYYLLESDQDGEGPSCSRSRASRKSQVGSGPT